MRKKILIYISFSTFFLLVVAGTFFLLRNYIDKSAEIDRNKKEVTTTYQKDNVDVSFPKALLADSVEGTVRLETDITSEDVEKVEYYANDTLIATSTVEPYIYQWDTTSLAKDAGSQKITFTIKVYDKEGIIATLSKPVTITSKAVASGKNEITAPKSTATQSSANKTTTTTSDGGTSSADSGNSTSQPAPPPSTACPSGTIGVSPNCYTTPPISPPSGSWSLQWQDEFSGSSLNTSNWSYSEPWKSSPGYQSNNAWRTLPAGDLVEVSGGSLKVKALNRPDNPLGLPMQAGMVISRDKFNSFTHGYIEARVAIPGGADLWSSFWLLGNGLGSEGWPKTGEIDIFEFVNNGGDNGKPHFTTHYGPDISTHYQKTQYGLSSLGTYTSMHTYGLYRTGSKLHMYIDGVYSHGFNAGDTDGSGHTLTSALFDNPMFAIFTITSGGWGDDPTAAPQDGQMVVDYIRAWNY